MGTGTGTGNGQRATGKQITAIQPALAQLPEKYRSGRRTLTDPDRPRTAQNGIWREIVQIAPGLPAWMPMLAPTGKAWLREPRRLRLRLFTATGPLVPTGRRRTITTSRLVKR